jgi:hypothetical protein
VARRTGAVRPVTSKRVTARPADSLVSSWVLEPLLAWGWPALTQASALGLNVDVAAWLDAARLREAAIERAAINDARGKRPRERRST